jgi:hypothetical protein
MPLPQRNTQNAKKEVSFFVLFSSAKACPIGQAATAVRPFVAASFPAFSGSQSPQIFKEQAPVRLTHSILPPFDGNANSIIQLFVIGQSRLVGTPRCGVRSAQRADPTFSYPRSLTDYNYF